MTLATTVFEKFLKGHVGTIHENMQIKFGVRTVRHFQ